jgi:hypothetical protein
VKLVLLLVLVAATSAAQTKATASQYHVANYAPGFKEPLRIFPFNGDMITIPLPFRLGNTVFSPGGMALYGTNTSGEDGVLRASRGLSKVEFNPIRISPVLGSEPFIIRSFAISAQQDRIVLSGSRAAKDGPRCGVFEILLPLGSVRQVLDSDCRYRLSWDHLSLSPDGLQAVATVGSNLDHDLHLELIDVVHGTARTLSTEFWMGVWSPDRKWIAALGNGNNNLVLIDTGKFTRKRTLGSIAAIPPAWSPDARYLTVWKYHLFRCGFYLDVQSPATLELIDTETGKRSTVKSSQCELVLGSTGWLSGRIMK